MEDQLQPQPENDVISDEVDFFAVDSNELARLESLAQVNDATVNTGLSFNLPFEEFISIFINIVNNNIPINVFDIMAKDYYPEPTVFIISDQAVLQNDYLNDLLLIKVLHDLYPYYSEIDLNNRNITIHFPELTITNDYGATHVIRDTFTFIIIDTFSVRIAYDTVLIRTSFEFRLKRSTKTDKEYAKNFTHPHAFPAQSGDSKLNVWLTCCLGSSELKLIKTELANDYEDVNRLYLLFASIKEYLQLERKGGVTGAGSIQTIGNLQLSDVSTNVSTIFVKAALKSIKDSTIDFIMLNNVEEQFVLTIDDTSLSNFLHAHMSLNDDYCVNYDPVNRATGNIVNTDNIDAINAKNLTIIKFRDKIFKFVVIPSTDNVEFEKVLHPTLIRFVKELITEALYIINNSLSTVTENPVEYDIPHFTTDDLLDLLEKSDYKFKTQKFVI